MIDASPFSSLDHATSFARQLWFKESRIQSWQDAFSGHSHLYQAIGHAPASIMRVCLLLPNLIIKILFIFMDETHFRMSRDKCQRESEEPGEVVPDSMEKDDVVSFNTSDEANSAGRKVGMLSYDLNKMLEENEYPYNGMSLGKKNAWHLATCLTQYLNP
ncbi:hypothetical protein Ahy_B04g072256 [Arachis hypogaea]|uniref:Uncharacterized protein n=1 Tax=Arachis hypogaea TaxID=3818 RepID=A0A444ZMV7_ARAHY|nr:hypothetical protein Ahy_B04g072256 [Arachis hypogaea]